MELNDIQNFLKESLSYSWSLYLLKFNKKSLGAYTADHIEVNHEYLKSTIEDILNTYIDKVMTLSGTMAYTEGIDPKGYMSYIENTDERIASNANRLMESLINSTKNLANKYTGYALVGKSESKNIVLITKSNPICSMKSLNMVPVNDDFMEGSMLKLSKRVDAIMFENMIYADSLKIEDIFGMQSTIRSICEANRAALLESKAFNEASNALLLDNHLFRSFQSLDVTNVSKLKTEKEELEILKKHGSFDTLPDGTIHIENISTTKVIIKYLSNKIVFKDGLAYQVGTLVPLPTIQ